MKKPLKVRTVKSEYELEISRDMLIEFANAAISRGDGTGPLNGCPPIPNNPGTSVVVLVPSGTDYSGLAMDITNKRPVMIRWTVIE